MGFTRHRFIPGGLHLALRRSGIPGAVNVVAAYDWDQTACQVYAENLGADLVHRVSPCLVVRADT